MRRMRRHIPVGLIAPALACLLLVQALFDSVGLGMSGGMPVMTVSGSMPAMNMPGMAATADMPGMPGMSGMAVTGRATVPDSRRAPAKTPFCPFCFVAAQLALHPVAPPAPPGMPIRPPAIGHAAWVRTGHGDAPRRFAPPGGHGPRAPPAARA